MFLINISNYWEIWRLAAHAARLDFNLIEILPDTLSIRFYELTKLLRVAAYDKTTGRIPDELEIDYERFVSLMPLPKFHSLLERKNQIEKLSKPLVERGYVKSFFYQANGRKERMTDKLVFHFEN